MSKKKPTIYTYYMADHAEKPGEAPKKRFTVHFAPPPYSQAETFDGFFADPAAAHAAMVKSDLLQRLHYVDQFAFELITTKFNASAALKRFVELMDAYESGEIDEFPSEEIGQLKEAAQLHGLRFRWIDDRTLALVLLEEQANGE